MITVGVHEAKTHLSKLLKRTENGEDVIIERNGVPIARLTPIPKRRRVGGFEGKGKFDDESFFAPVPELDEFFK